MPDQKTGTVYCYDGPIEVKTDRKYLCPNCGEVYYPSADFPWRRIETIKIMCTCGQTFQITLGDQSIDPIAPEKAVDDALKVIGEITCIRHDIEIMVGRIREQCDDLTDFSIEIGESTSKLRELLKCIATSSKS